MGQLLDTFSILCVWLFLCSWKHSDFYCKVFRVFEFCVFSLVTNSEFCFKVWVFVFLTTNFLYSWKPWMFSEDYRRGVCLDDFGCWIWNEWTDYSFLAYEVTFVKIEYKRRNTVNLPISTLYLFSDIFLEIV